jgi:hypothetical protein
MGSSPRRSRPRAALKLGSRNERYQLGALSSGVKLELQGRFRDRFMSIQKIDVIRVQAARLALRVPAAVPDWLKFKNPAAPTLRREAEEDWGKGRWR